MASISPDSFRRALANFKAHLSQDEEEEFHLTSLKDLKITINAIQRKQASEKTMQNLRELSVFLEGMEQYTNLIELFLTPPISLHSSGVLPSLSFHSIA